MGLKSIGGLNMLDYTPKHCTWEQAIILASQVKEKIGAKRLINLRVARGGCFVARYLLGFSIAHAINGGQVVDRMVEIKIYDNMPYLTQEEPHADTQGLSR